MGAEACSASAHHTALPFPIAHSSQCRRLGRLDRSGPNKRNKDDERLFLHHAFPNQSKTLWDITGRKKFGCQKASRQFVIVERKIALMCVPEKKSRLESPPDHAKPGAHAAKKSSPLWLLYARTSIQCNNTLRPSSDRCVVGLCEGQILIQEVAGLVDRPIAIYCCC